MRTAAATAVAAAIAATTAFAPSPTSVTVTQGVFQSPAHNARSAAVTYDRAAVPEFSRIQVTQRTHGGRAGNGGTQVGLRVHELQPNRAFGAHVHSEACGAKPDASGPHYQNRKDPAAAHGKPSTNPAYANPRNEVWLDLRTDPNGNGRSSADVNWRFRPGQAKSVVLHAHRTHTGPGQAGEAGDRLACVNVGFKH